jgi:fucose 4-O-acetylase-like acetyltransferase
VRRNDIDWLRIAATLLLFPFHSARPFDHGPWHVKSATLSDGFDVFVWFVHQFHMPLFFVLAGWSIARSLERRSPADVRRERYGRLLLPFVVGVILLSPPQAYVEAVTQRGFSGTFLEFLPRFFGSLEYFSWHHLWFLIYLFTFTMLYLPLFGRLQRTRLALDRPRALYLSIVPFAAVQLALRWRWPGYQNLYDDWANFAWYSLFFIGGFVLARSPELEATIRRERRRSAAVFALAILAMLPILATLRGRIVTPAGAYLLYWPLNATAGVCGVAALLGHGARLATVDGPAFRYLRESALPVYVLHHPAIVLLGYWIASAAAPLGVRYLELLGASVLVTFAVYHLAIRGVRPVGVLLGMKPAGVGLGIPR